MPTMVVMKNSALIVPLLITRIQASSLQTVLKKPCRGTVKCRKGGQAGRWRRVSRNSDSSHNARAGHPAWSAVGIYKEVATMNASLIAVVTVALSAPLGAQWL